jgi:hypothetical protein
MANAYSHSQRTLARAILVLFALVLEALIVNGESLVATYGLWGPPAYQTVTSANLLPAFLVSLSILLAAFFDAAIFLLLAGCTLWAIGKSANWIWSAAFSHPSFPASPQGE